MIRRGQQTAGIVDLSLTTLLGDLIGVPWRRAHAVPSATVLSTWRAAIGAEP